MDEMQKKKNKKKHGWCGFIGLFVITCLFFVKQNPAYIEQSFVV